MLQLGPSSAARSRNERPPEPLVLSQRVGATLRVLLAADRVKCRGFVRDNHRVQLRDLVRHRRRKIVALLRICLEFEEASSRAVADEVTRDFVRCSVRVVWPRKHVLLHISREELPHHVSLDDDNPGHGSAFSLGWRTCNFRAIHVFVIVVLAPISAEAVAAAERSVRDVRRTWLRTDRQHNARGCEVRAENQLGVIIGIDCRKSRRRSAMVGGVHATERAERRVPIPRSGEAVVDSAADGGGQESA